MDDVYSVKESHIRQKITWTCVYYKWTQSSPQKLVYKWGPTSVSKA